MYVTVHAYPLAVCFSCFFYLRPFGDWVNTEHPAVLVPVGGTVPAAALKEQVT